VRPRRFRATQGRRYARSPFVTDAGIVVGVVASVVARAEDHGSDALQPVSHFAGMAVA
jgi:hypothetical protein